MWKALVAKKGIVFMLLLVSKKKTKIKKKKDRIIRYLLILTIGFKDPAEAFSAV